MTVGTLHQLASDLCLIEGDDIHDATPTIAVYRASERLFVFGTGRELAQQQGIVDAATLLCGRTGPRSILLLTSRVHPLQRMVNDGVLTAFGQIQRLHVQCYSPPYDQLGAPGDIQVGDAQWQGWTFRGHDDRRDVQVLVSGRFGGKSVVFYLPAHRLIMLGDEIAPRRPSEDTARAVATISKALSMLDTGELETVCGERASLRLGRRGDQARAALVAALAALATDTRRSLPTPHAANRTTRSF